MNFFIPFLMLTMPGIIAVCLHNKQLIHFTHENWQTLLWEFLLYSFSIIIFVNFVMFLTFPERTVSFSPWMANVTSHVLSSSFIVKYSVLAILFALFLPNLWLNRKNLKSLWKNHMDKIGEDD